MGSSAGNMTCIPPQWLLPLSTPIKAHRQPSSPDHDDASTPLLLEKGLFPDGDEMNAARFTSRALPMVLALPWVVSMLISWIPFTKIGLLEAPTFVTMAAAVSTLEVLSIIAVFIYTSVVPAAEPSSESSRAGTILQEKILRAWFWFLFVSPLVSSILVVLMASDISCGDDEEDDLVMQQPICKVGIRLIKASALCRAAIIAIFLFAMSSWLDSRSPKTTEAKSQRRAHRDTPRES